MGQLGFLIFNHRRDQPLHKAGLFVLRQCPHNCACVLEHDRAAPLGVHEGLAQSCSKRGHSLYRSFAFETATIRPDLVKTLIYLKPSSDQRRKLALLEHNSRTSSAVRKESRQQPEARCEGSKAKTVGTKTHRVLLGVAAFRREVKVDAYVFPVDDAHDGRFQSY